MIQLSHEEWFELAEACLDDSTGAIDEPEFIIDIDDECGTINLKFATPAAETFFRLRWMS